MQINSIVSPIIHWFHNNKRNLPFRETKDPYKIWLSEVMLQQTQVKTVIPYYLNWIKKYPDIQSVANSDLKSLLKIWEGLGYYNRCINIFNSAKIIVKKYNGVFPNNWERFRLLPGVGDYTCAAVLSIAFGKPFASLDVNTKRVMSRLLKIKNMTTFNTNRIKRILTTLIPHSQPGDFNQSLMELGALICTPKNPHCKICPISFCCKANITNTQQDYPKITKRKKVPNYIVVVGIILRDKKFFIQRRAPGSMLGGLWEFPGGKVEKDETLEAALTRELYEECGIRPIIIKKIGHVNHTYSHFSINFHGFYCAESNQKINQSGETKWITPDQIHYYPFPKANHKLFQIIEKQGWYV